MKKLDSAIRETLRASPTQIAVTMRKVITSHTFSDGTRVREGSWVAEPVVHANDSRGCYDKLELYNGFRFVDMAEGEKPVRGYLIRLFVVGSWRECVPGKVLRCRGDEDWVPVRYGREAENSTIGVFQVPDASVELEFRRRKLGREE